MKTQINIDRELFMARNMLGVLDNNYKDRIRAVVENPTQKTWDDTHCIIIGSDGWTTLWQAVLAVDPSFPRSARHNEDGSTNWTKIPNTGTILQALNYATH